MKFRKMSFVLCMILFILSGISVYAAESELGVSLGEKGASVELSMHRIADVQEGEFKWLSEYEGINIELSSLRSAEETKAAAESISNWIEEKNIAEEQTGTADESGTVLFKVKPGAYLILKKSEEGTMLPVLLMLPEDHNEEYLIIAPKYSAPDDPNNPDNPDGPDNPDNPDNPDGPDNPDNPDNPDDPNTSNDNVTTTARTGDAANIILWIVLLIVALVGIIVLARKNHRRK